MATLVVSPVSGANNQGFWDVSSTTLGHFEVSLGDPDSGPAVLGSYVWMPAVAIPQGATITSAVMDFVNWEASTGVTSSIRTHASDNSTKPAELKSDIVGRTRTTASTSWATGALTPGQSVVTPNFSGVVQEVVNRAGWVSGSGMTVIFDYVSGAYTAFKSGTDSGYVTPKMTVNYTAGGPPVVITTDFVGWGIPI